MEFQNFYYLLVLFIYLPVPVFMALKSKILFWNKIRYYIPAILFSAAIFILWDIRFTQLGIWQFNPDYITGIYLLKIPIEECLSFIIIPFSSFYIYEILKSKYEQLEKPNLFLSISLVFLVIFAITAFIAREKLYTFFTFFLLSIYFAYTIFRNRFKHHYTKFYLTFLITLFPFFLVSFLLNRLPAKSYDILHHLKLTLFSVPIENLAYLFLMILINITIYENIRDRKLF